MLLNEITADDRTFGIAGILLLSIWPAITIYQYLRWQRARQKNMTNEQFTLFGIQQASQIFTYFVGSFFSPTAAVFSLADLVPDGIDEWNVELTKYPYNDNLDRYLPWNGRIVKRLDLIYSDFFYLVKLNKPISFDGYETNYLLVTKMPDHGDLGDGVHYIMQVFLIPLGALVDNDVKERKGLNDLGNVRMTLEPLKAEPTAKSKTPVKQHTTET